MSLKEECYQPNLLRAICSSTSIARMHLRCFCVDFFAALRLAIGTNLDSGDLPLRMEAIQIAEKLYSLVVGANYAVKKLPDRQSLAVDADEGVKLAVIWEAIPSPCRDKNA